MRTETITRDLYTFTELSDDAKQNALDTNRDWNVQDEFWYECVIDDAKEIGAMLGIEIDKIYFSGFSRQGDGACFVGSYSYKKGALTAVMEHAPLDTELHRIARELQELQRRNFYGLSASVEHQGHYYHEMCTVIDVDDTRDRCTEDDADALRELLRDYMRWIYRWLECEYDYLTSDDSVRESLEASECEFTETGERD